MPGLPIVVDADSEREALTQAREVIRFWFEQHPGGSHRILRHVDGRGLGVAFHGTIRRSAVRKTLRLARVREDEFLEAF